MTKAVPACSPAYGRPRRSSPEYPDEVVRARLALVIVPKTSSLGSAGRTLVPVPEIGARRRRDHVDAGRGPDRSSPVSRDVM
jgi:hypothetical protein